MEEPESADRDEAVHTLKSAVNARISQNPNGDPQYATSRDWHTYPNTGTCRTVPNHGYKRIHDDILPFVRDEYGVALRTLVDGVLYAAGWDGEGSRKDFMVQKVRRSRRRSPLA
jgi:hypothetical protein